jgi:hypothetical protein
MTQYTKMTKKMQLFRIIYYSLAALHVSSDIFAHHQEHLNSITASGITHVCRSQMAAQSKARLLRLWVRTLGGGRGCLSVVSVVCCQVEVSASG